MLSSNYHRLPILDSEDVETIFDCAKDLVLDRMLQSGMEFSTCDQIQVAIAQHIKVHLEVVVGDITGTPY